MFYIQFHTTEYRPNRRVTIRCGPDWTSNIAGVYSNGAWRFLLSQRFYRDGFTFKFVLDGSQWMLGENLFLRPEGGKTYDFDASTVQFPIADTHELSWHLVENGTLAQRLFAPDLEGRTEYDLIVIGSGVGGGIVAASAAARGRRVLVLEVGGYLLPTHVGNLPRRHRLGGAAYKNIWDLWHDLKVSAYENEVGSYFAGGLGLNLGGRSLYWGAYIPRMADFEFVGWPTEVRHYLQGEGYARAEALLRRATLQSPYQEEVRRLLLEKLPGFTVAPLPLAIDQTDVAIQAVPCGIFSTVDLLTERRLAGLAEGDAGLTINLNHRVERIVTEGRRATHVVATDLLDGTTRRFRGRAVVLAAGSIQSPVIALASSLADPSGLLGQGLTDHPILFAHFAIEPASLWHAPDSAAKLTFHHTRATATDHRYLGIMDLGADASLSRFVDPALRAAYLQGRGALMPAELVYQFAAPLMDEHRVTPAERPGNPARVFIQESPVTPAEWAELQERSMAIVQALGGVTLHGGPLTLQRAPLGGVAHEAGTLRMGLGGVVDSHLRLHAYDNLYACDLSVLPSSPAANPTLTLAALALRLADEL